MRYLILVFLTMGYTSINAQQLVAISKLTNQEIQQEAKKGHFQWKFPEGTSAASIEKTAQYYTTYFTYTFNNDTKLVDVFPVSDSEDTRRIMLRFLGANQVGKILVGVEEFDLYAYYEKFMKSKVD